MSDELTDSSSGDSEPGPEHFRQIATRLQDQIENLSRSIDVSILSLDGTTRTLALTSAVKQASVRSDDLRDALRSIIVDARMRDHDQRSLSKERAEPETPREWLAALTTGRAAIAMASGVGSFAMRLLQVGLIASLIGLSAQAAGTLALIDRAQVLELGLIGSSNDAELKKAAASAAPRDVASSCDAACADDATTVIRLRTQFRTGAARALQQELGTLAKASANRTAFELGAVDARQAILAQAERPAAPSLDPGAEGHTFRASAAPHPSSARDGDILDQAFKRRVDTLRAHEPTWQRLRGWAARPIPPDYAAEAFLRTALGDVDSPALHSVRAWSEQASFQFARDIAHGGDPLTAAHALGGRRIESPFHHFGTARDGRLFRDFSAGVPERVNGQLAAYSAGELDPGSLQRTVGKSNVHVPNSYGEFFPGATEGGATSGGSGGAGGRGEVSGTRGRTPGSPETGAGSRRVAMAAEGRAATSVASARSYTRVRFSGRVGGVVFGRPADSGGKSPDVVDLRWETRTPKAMTLIVRMRDGSAVSLGPYHPALIHHALAFVADGRVVVATLPQPTKDAGGGLQIPARRVVVHPAFEDTPFACNAIQIDRFVDSFTRVPPGVQASGRLERIASARTAVSYLGAILGAREPITDKEADELLPGIQRHVRACKSDAQCFPLTRYREMGVNFGPVDGFLRCLRDNELPAQQRACMADFAPKRTGNGYLVDSGVRERAYKVDPKLEFVSGADHRNEKTWPIEFMIQAVPLVQDGDLNVGANQDPWQFPTISEDVQGVVAQAIGGDRNAQAVFGNVRDFVALQRMFRTALSGDLGESFPLDALVRLSVETKQHVRVQRNERWNVNDSFLEFAIRVQAFAVRELQGVRIDRPGKCQQRIADMKAADERQQVGIFDFWRAFAKVDVDCSSEASMGELINLQKALRRQEFIGELLEMERAADTNKRTALYCAPL